MTLATRRKVIIGNWKTNTTATEAGRLAQAIVAGEGRDDQVVVAICPPFPYLALVGEILKDSHVALGAQNLYPEKEGAFTGEVSPTMLLDLGCKYVVRFRATTSTIRSAQSPARSRSRRPAAKRTATRRRFSIRASPNRIAGWPIARPASGDGLVCTRL